MFAKITNTFALWLLLGVLWAWVAPGHFTWFLPYIPVGLGLIMLGMGVTLRFEDFAEALKEPGNVVLGVVAQFAIMPMLGWGVARIVGPPPSLAAGLILVACCPGGTASNVITHLAGGNVPLSVLMTACSTLAAVALTPLLTRWLAARLLKRSVTVARTISIEVGMQDSGTRRQARQQPLSGPDDRRPRRHLSRLSQPDRQRTGRAMEATVNWISRGVGATKRRANP